MKKLLKNTCTALLALFCIGVPSMQAQESQDSTVNVAFGTQNKDDVLGAVSSVNMTELLKKNYQTNTLEGLGSFVSGYNGNIWGQGALVLVDGVPRSADNLDATEVETVNILKGANAVVLYGSKAAKGVILIKTKRGKEHPLKIEARANTGLFVPKSYPKYLDAASYMTLYNEAADNDGIAHIYSDEEIYYTQSGSNPYRYPDVNYLSSDYLRKAYSKTDATVEVSGGNAKTRYYTNFGMSYNNDILNYGEQANNKDANFRVRGNVDMQLTEWLSASTNAHVIYNNNVIGRGNFWGEAETMRPNLVAPLIPINSLDPNSSSLQATVANSNHLIDGQYLLGGTSVAQTTAFSDMLAAGYIRYKDRVFQFDVNINADLGGIIEGLSFSNTFSLDYVNFYSEAYKLDYATYEPVWANMNGEDMIVDLHTYGEDKNSTSEYLGDSKFTQTTTFRSQLNYDRVFNNVNNVSGNLVAWGFQYRNSVDDGHDGSDYHSVSSANLGMQLAYNYDQRYYADFSGSIVHSAKLPEANRNAFSPSLTLGWRLSEENFLKDVSFINNLKLNASYAKLHQDIDIDKYYMYNGYYKDDGWMNWRDGTMGGGLATLSQQGANPYLDFVTREEFRVGLEGTMIDQKLAFELNYFNQKTDGLLTDGASTIYPSYFTGWGYSYLPNINFNADKRSGLDFSVSHQNKIGEFSYQVGVVGMLYNTEALVRDEVYAEQYLYREGRSINASYGYVCEGFFADEADIANHSTQTFGEVKPGDLKYKDINRDGKIDTQDQIELGKNSNGASPFTYGVNLTLNYKNWTLFAMGQGQSGAIAYKNSSYYWVYGNRKYSEQVLDRWTPATAATATYPRLSTTSGTNNFRNSTFWQYDDNRFNLSKVQLTYNFSDELFNENSLLSQMSIYVSGLNLLTISKEHKMMDMNVGRAPQYRFYNIGIKASF